MDVATVMNLGQGIGESAGRIWFLAYQQKFTRGRRGELVVGACVYLACRQRSDPPPVMLIDFSDRLNNVSCTTALPAFMARMTLTSLNLGQCL